MQTAKNKRTEQRLRYPWLIQFAPNVKEPLSQGQIIDLSSTGLAFLCYINNKCPKPGQLLTTRFSVPMFDSQKCFDSVSFNRIGRVCRVHTDSDLLSKVAIRFARPLPFKPGQQPISKYDRTFQLVTNSKGISAAFDLKFNPKDHYKTIPEKTLTK
ncbi:PilZ domain-containing protein [Planctomycetota bacterium]